MHNERMKEQFVVCTYRDHGYGYEPDGIYEDIELANSVMDIAAENGRHAEMWGFSLENTRRFIKRKASVGSDE